MPTIDKLPKEQNIGLSTKDDDDAELMKIEEGFKLPETIENPLEKVTTRSTAAETKFNESPTPIV